MISLGRKRKTKRKFGFLFVLSLLIVLVLFGIISTEYVLKQLYPVGYSEYVEVYAKQYKLDKNLVYSMIKAESGFDSQAISPRDAKGLMQILDSTGEWAAQKIKIENFETSMLLEPETNIRIGCWYISTLIKQFDQNVDVALAAYNAGSGNVAKWLKDPTISSNGVTLDRIPFEETDNYVAKIKKYITMYDKLYNKAQ